MASSESEFRDPSDGSAGGNYPLRETAAKLNDRLGLFLSEEQQRGLAATLLIGAAIGGALLAWNIGQAIRGD